MDNQKPNKSETLAQRDKARKDFLELKRMQQNGGENQGEHIPYSNEIKPKTLLEKVKHFLDYNWGKVIAVILTTIILAVIVVQCANKVNPDIKIVIFDNRILANAAVPSIEEYFESYCPDYNGDGKVEVSVINCTYETGASTAEYQQAMMQKLQSVIAVDTECMLVLTSQNGYNYFIDFLDTNLLGKGIELPKSYYQQQLNIDGISIPKDMTLYVRNIEDTLIEDKDTAKKAVANSKDFMKILESIK